MIIHTNCRFYLGDIPCQPHKRSGVHCKSCEHYDPIKERILIIKLGAIGDVIRTTPILRKLKDLYPNAQIHWLTHTPEVIPSSVDRIYMFNVKDILVLQEITFDIILNLDKDKEACALANRIEAKQKMGFSFIDGSCFPIGNAAKAKWINGLFDDENIKNTKSYPQEIFEICGFKYNMEKYILEVKEKREWKFSKKKIIIGLNTGCGERWRSRLWPFSHWAELASLLKQGGYEVILLGGHQEDEKNRRLAEQTGAIYPGYFKLQTFIDLLDQCKLVVTAVTMALHIALGLNKKVVLFNNIFNSHEFELFSSGIIVEPPKECKGCYRNECDEPCMELVLPEIILSHIKHLLSE